MRVTYRVQSVYRVEVNSRYQSTGFFLITLLVVAVSSTVLLRGMVSVIAAVTLIAVAFAFSWFGWWGYIFGFFDGLEIRINSAGYRVCDVLCAYAAVE